MGDTTHAQNMSLVEGYSSDITKGVLRVFENVFTPEYCSYKPRLPNANLALRIGPRQRCEQGPAQHTIVGGNSLKRCRLELPRHRRQQGT